MVSEKKPGGRPPPPALVTNWTVFGAQSFSSCSEDTVTWSLAKASSASIWMTAWISEGPVSTSGLGATETRSGAGVPPDPVAPPPPPAVRHLAPLGCLAHLAAAACLAVRADAVPATATIGMAATRVKATTRDTSFCRRSICPNSSSKGFSPRLSASWSGAVITKNDENDRIRCTDYWQCSLRGDHLPPAAHQLPDLGHRALEVGQVPLDGPVGGEEEKGHPDHR